MAINRRRFLSWIGAAGAGIAVSGKAFAGSEKHYAGHPGSNGVLHDITRCIGCRSCEQACNTVSKLPQPDTPFTDLSVLDRERRTTTDAYTIVNKYRQQGNPPTVYRKHQCNHCLEPACASVCFVRAFKKLSGGPVVYDPSVCVGCRYCMVACPFDVPTYDYHDPLTPEVKKCNMCSQRLKKGFLPGCVEVCPKEALTFGNRSDLLTVARRRISRYPDKYMNHIYGEKEMGGTSWIYLSGVSFSSLGMREDLGFIPAPKLTSGALSAVPIVVGLWPVFLVGMYGMSVRREKIAKEEKEMAIALAMEEVNELAEEKLEQALQKAEADKEKAMEKAEKEKERAVKDALKSLEPEGRQEEGDG